MLIDATAIPANRGGVGRYVDSIVGALVAAGAQPVVACQPHDRALFESMGARTVAAPPRVARVGSRLLWEQFGLPKLARRCGVDLVHSPHYTFPLFLRLPRIVTIHDLTFFTLPKLHSLLKRVFFRGWIRAARLFKVPVIAVSQATAAEFIRITRAQPALVTVSHLGYDEALFHVPDEESIQALRAAVPDLPDNWVAFLGTLEPRKNVAALIEGYCAAATPAVGAPPLLLAGDDGWDEQVAPAIIRAEASSVDVRRLGYLPLKALAAFLGGSTLFVYPSLGEGFGLPVLEAMACGASVLTTDRLALPEVGGNAVAYTDVSPVAIANSLRELLGSDARRAELAQAGLERATQFTWASAATRHLEAYAAAAR